MNKTDLLTKAHFSKIMQMTDCPVCFESLSGKTLHGCDLCKKQICSSCFFNLRVLLCPMCRNPYHQSASMEDNIPIEPPRRIRRNAIFGGGAITIARFRQNDENEPEIHFRSSRGYFNVVSDYSS